MSDIILSAEELTTLTGYKRPAEQLRVLHRRGFYRACISEATRQVILERSHYLAITGRAAANAEAMRPRVRV